MSSRYTITTPPHDIASRFEVDVTPAYKPRFNLAPAQLAPVITSSAPQGLSFFYWGLITKWANNKAISEKLYLAHTDQIAEKPSLKQAVMQRRCLIPADGFYEWKRISRKSLVPYYHFERHRLPFAIAGLWEEFEDGGEAEHSFVMITCAANTLVAETSAKMPAILDKNNEKAWLNPSTPYEQLIQMLKPYPTVQMQRHSVSPKVNQLKYDDPELILPAPPADQFGNYTLFD